MDDYNDEPCGLEPWDYPDPDFKAEVGMPEWEYPDEYWLVPGWDSKLKADKAQRLSILEQKMSLPEPKSLACPKAPPEPDADASFPWPAQVQAFLRDEGIEQFPASFCMEWWLENSSHIRKDCYEYEGLSRSDQYRIGLKGGYWDVGSMGVEHWYPGDPPEPPPTWDSDDDKVVPATPSYVRTDEENEILISLWRDAMPKLKKFGLKHLGSRRYLAAWLSDVRLAFLSAMLYVDCEVSGMEVTHLPSLDEAGTLVDDDLKNWPKHPWYTVLRRLARNWAEHGNQGAGARRPDSTARHTYQAEHAKLEAKECHRQGTGVDHSVASIAMFAKISSHPAIESFDNERIKDSLLRAAQAATMYPDASRPEQAKHAGLGRSTFLERLSLLKQLIPEVSIA